MSVLLLNASYEPLAVVSWKRAMTLILTGRAELVTQDDDRVLRSAGGTEFPFPDVVRLLRMVSFAGMRDPSGVAFSKAALRARDGGRCQVSDCDERGDTIDHLVPSSRGGDTSWHNCVLMCRVHNATKDDRTLDEMGWSLKQRPTVPSGRLVLASRRPEWDAWFATAGV